MFSLLDRVRNLRAYLSHLVRVGLVFAALGALVAFLRTAPPAEGTAGLAEALGAASASRVSPEDIAWEDGRTGLTGAALGRWVLFLARGEEEARDVWRAKVRVSPEGRAIEVMEAHDLTETALDDDHSLVVRGRYAAFATTQYGQERSVTVLDLQGEGAQNRAATLVERFTNCAMNLQERGQCAGIGRLFLTFDRPARKVALAFPEEGKLAITLESDDVAPSTLTVDVAQPPESVPGISIQPASHNPKQLTHWAVDTARAVPWIGAEKIAWLEANVFKAKDDGKKLAHSLHREPVLFWLLTAVALAAGAAFWVFRRLRGVSYPFLACAAVALFLWYGFEAPSQVAAASTETLAATAVEEGDDTPPAVLDTSEASVESAHWPPPTIPSLWATAKEGEGEWVAPKLPWQRDVPGLDPSAPPAFVQTYVRPDKERPYAKVWLMAMDTRQLDLDMEAGSEDPRPLSGPPGKGQLSRDPAIYKRVVALWNGGFKTEHGRFGMMVRKRELLPPQPGASSVVVLKDGRIGMGSWGKETDYAGIEGVAAEDVVSMRQNMEPLVDHTQINPSGRFLWGWAAPGKGAATDRSGMCVTSGGHLVYAWSDDATAISLAKAMRMAGCDYGMHLDMNAGHTGLLLSHIEDFSKGKSGYQSVLMTREMGIHTHRFIEASPKDFFYVMTRDPRPPVLEGGAAWQADGGTQPAPAWMPAIWTTKAEVAEGTQVELFDVEAGRATFRLRAGTKDAPVMPGMRTLDEADAKRVLFAVGMGVTNPKELRGLKSGGSLLVPMHAAEKGSGTPWAALVVGKDGALSIQDSGEIDRTADYAELPLLLLQDAVFPRTGQTFARAALGITPEGRVVIARGTFASDVPLAEALKRAGCTRAVLLDEGSSPAPLLHRSGLAPAPLATYEESVLYGVAVAMKPRGFAFQAKNPAPFKPPSHSWPF